MDTVTRGKDAPTFEEYAGAAWPSLYRCAYLLAGNHADAEDIAQQTLLKAYRSWSRVERSDSPPAYLRQILTNTYLSQRRPKARNLELLTDAPPETGHRTAAGPEDRMALWPHVKSLPPRQRGPPDGRCGGNTPRPARAAPASEPTPTARGSPRGPGPEPV